MKWIGRPVAEIWPFEILKIFQHGGGRHLGFVQTVNSAVRSAVPENPTLEPNMKWIGSPVAEIWPFAQINRGWVTLGLNLGVFPLEQTRHVGVAKSERPRLTNGEIIFEEFQPM